jgi:hypothetical protein
MRHVLDALQCLGQIAARRVLDDDELDALAVCRRQACQQRVLLAERAQRAAHAVAGRVREERVEDVCGEEAGDAGEQDERHGVVMVWWWCEAARRGWQERASLASPALGRRLTAFAGLHRAQPVTAPRSHASQARIGQPCSAHRPEARRSLAAHCQLAVATDICFGRDRSLRQGSKSERRIR